MEVLFAHQLTLFKMSTLTQMEGGVTQAISLIRISAMAQQQLHLSSKYKKKKHFRDIKICIVHTVCVLLLIQGSLTHWVNAVNEVVANVIYTVMIMSHRCFHCHCRKRNAALSFPCRLLHRGLCCPAGAFELMGAHYD